MIGLHIKSNVAEYNKITEDKIATAPSIALILFGDDNI